MIKDLSIHSTSDHFSNLLPLLEIVAIKKGVYNSDDYEVNIDGSVLEKECRLIDENTYYAIETTKFFITLNYYITSLHTKPDVTIEVSDLELLLNALPKNNSINLDSDNDLSYDLLTKIVSSFNSSYGIYVCGYKTEATFEDKYQYLKMGSNYILYNQSQFKIYTIQPSAVATNDIYLKLQAYPFIRIGTLEYSSDIYDGFEAFDSLNQITNQFDLSELEYLL